MMSFWYLLKNELLRLFLRKRSYIGYIVFLALEIFLLFLLRSPTVQSRFQRVLQSNGYGFEEYFSGLTIGFLVLFWSLFLLGALYLSLIGGDIVAKEVEDGTMRMLLCRPASRNRILTVKFLSVFIYTFSLVTFIALSALLFGMIQAGWGGLFVFIPAEAIFEVFPPTQGLMRYLASIPFLTLSMTIVTSLAFMLSCLRIKPATASILTLSILFVDMILHNIPYFDSFHQYFLTARVGAWLLLFHEHIPWHTLIQEYSWLFGLNATFVLIGFALFNSRDLK